MSGQCVSIHYTCPNQTKNRWWQFHHRVHYRFLSFPQEGSHRNSFGFKQKIVFKVYFVFSDETVRVPLLLQKELQDKENYKSSLAIL